MADDLPDEFDLVVIGTGFSESCIAAAASRIGKSVLHIDPNDYYGGSWASFNLENFSALLTAGTNAEVRHGVYKWHVPAVHDGNTTETLVTEWSQAQVLEHSRRFNLDLCPKILYAAGKLVQLLVSSNICRYAEFRAVDRVCTLFHDELLSVPCSRSDVFNTKDLSMVEKRLLMKFLTICMSYGEDKCEEDLALYRNTTFREYLLQQQLTEKISTCVTSAIAMCSEETSFEDGMKQTKLFLQSLGRYGNTPFLFPMYGCGELPQCFCRLCAVFGGLYCLKRRIHNITIDADTNRATVHVEGKLIHAKHVVCSHGNVPRNLRESNVTMYGHGHVVNGLSRGIFITSTPLGNEDLNAGGGGVNLLRLIAGPREAILIQLSHYSGTCPKGLYVFHLTTQALSDSPESDLQFFTIQIFNSKPESPKMLYSAYFTLTTCVETTDDPTTLDASSPIFCTSAPFYELDYDLSINNAHEIFAKLYGKETEFLPRAPDPEEIVIEGEDPRALNEINLPDDLRAQLRALEKAAEQMDITDGGNNVSENAIGLEEVECAQEMDAD